MMREHGVLQEEQIVLSSKLGGWREIDKRKAGADAGGKTGAFG